MEYPTLSGKAERRGRKEQNDMSNEHIIFIAAIIWIGWTAGTVAGWLRANRRRKELQAQRDSAARQNEELNRKIDQLTAKNREMHQLLIDKIRETDAWNREKEEMHAEAVQKFQEEEKLHNAFFTEVIHEIRTPLSLVLGSLSEALHQPGKDTDLSARLLSAYRNTWALHDLILQLRAARLGEEVADHWRIARYDLVQVTQEICDLFVDWIAMNNVDFRIDTQTPVLWVWTDRRKMEFALRTLVSNALKNTFMYGRIEIGLSVIRKADGKSYCQVSVRDEGLSENENTRPGLKQIADMAGLSGAEFRETAPEEGGTCYTIVFPLGRRHLHSLHVEFVEPDDSLLHLNDWQKEEIAELIRVIPQKKKTGRKLLVIDDSTQIRWFLKHALAKEYHIVEASDGEEGVRTAREEKPDLVLCDVMMPRKDGLEVCRELRADPVTRPIPVILLTAKVDSKDVIAGIECGADDYVTKPFDVEILRSKIAQVLKRQEEMKRYYTRSHLPATPGMPADSLSASGDTPETPANEAARTFMEGVIRTIEKHLDDPGFEAKVLAESLHMSLPTLYRKIKMYSDSSILELTRAVRLQKAAELIVQQKYAIQEVAERVGFNDLATFRKRFTEQYGVPPSQYLSSLEGEQRE